MQLEQEQEVNSATVVKHTEETSATFLQGGGLKNTGGGEDTFVN